MSSTNRGGERNTDDFYATPTWAVNALLRRLGPLSGKRILEPSAGKGAIVRGLLTHGADPSRVTAVEQDLGRCAEVSLLVDEAIVSTLEMWEPGGDAMAEALLRGLARAGLCLDTTPRDEHLRLNIRDGWARVFGMLVLSGAGEDL